MPTPTFLTSISPSSRYFSGQLGYVIWQVTSSGHVYAINKKLKSRIVRNLPAHSIIFNPHLEELTPEAVALELNLPLEKERKTPVRKTLYLEEVYVHTGFCSVARFVIPSDRITQRVDFFMLHSLS